MGRDRCPFTLWLLRRLRNDVKLADVKMSRGSTCTS